MNKRCLISGGAGYVGCVLSRYLLEKEIPITVFDKFYFDWGNVNNLTCNDLILNKGDIRKPSKDLFDDVSAVIHLAAFSNDPTADASPEINRKINTEATVSLAKKAKEAGVKRFIFASTASIYDKGITNSFDRARAMSDENTEVNPVHNYSKSKYEAEKELLKLADDDFCVVVLRKGTVHGYSPRMRFDLVINSMLKNALKDRIIKIFCRGVQVRPIIDLKDVARAYFKALITSADKVNGQIFNIAYKNMQVSDMAFKVQMILEKQFGIYTKIVFENDDSEDRSYSMSLDKAKNILGFTARIPIKDSIMDMMYWIEKGVIEDFDDPIYYNIKWMTPIFEKEKK